MSRSSALSGTGRVGRAAALAFLLASPLPAAASALPDGRGWELVSPIEKNGGDIPVPGAVAGGGVFQAAAGGSAVAYSSAASFATGAQGTPPGSQYLAARSAAGWSTENLNIPLFSGSYGSVPDGVPYQLFSPDLLRGLVLNGRHCRGQEAGCPVANPPLPGTDAPAGYQDYYLRRAGLGFEALIGSDDAAHTSIDPAAFGVRLAGSAPDLNHAVLETCAALTGDATEVALGAGCDPNAQNLYEWTAGAGLGLVNAAPGAELAAPAGAISGDGGRVYFRDLSDGNLYLRDGGTIAQVDAAAGGGGVFETASADGSVAVFTKLGHLWRYTTTAGTATDLTPGGEVLGVLGASADAASVYYLAAGGLSLWRSGTTAVIAPGAAAADSTNFPPATGTARVSADGARLLFVSSASLTGYDNLDQSTGLPDSQVFLYDAALKALRCVSCRQDGTRPRGPSSIPGALANGQLAGATEAYKPRAISLDGRRVFFDSRDALVPQDSNLAPDVYEWAAPGGACTKGGGCVELLSSGRSPEGAAFVDASETGDDVFFVTDGSLVESDPGAFDLYDARVGGGFPREDDRIRCIGDSCRDLPSEPVDPALNTLAVGLGNPKVHYYKYRRPPEPCRGAPKKRAKCHKQGKGKKKGKGKGKKGAGKR
jgi:hypothetical protein